MVERFVNDFEMETEINLSDSGASSGPTVGPTVGPPPSTAAAISSASIIDFMYADTDTHLAEVAELYSYNEEADFTANRTAFEELMEDYGFPLKWSHMSAVQQHRAIERMSEGVEVIDRGSRTRAIRALLYLCQGNFADCPTIEDQPKNARKNIFALFDFGFLPVFVQLIHFEIANALKMDPTSPIPSPNDPNSNLKLLISIVYLFVLEMSVVPDSDTEDMIEIRGRFIDEITQPISGELLHLTLFEMVGRLCNGTGAKFPMKKILLLLWKLLLLTLGGTDQLREMKDRYRAGSGLKPIPDDTLEVARRIRPASPPPTAVEMIDSAHQRKLNRPFKRQTVVKQNSFGEDNNFNTNANFVDNGDDEIMNDDAFEAAAAANGSNGGNAPKDADQSGTGSGSPRPSSPLPEVTSVHRSEEAQLKQQFLINSKSLPWIPKVRQKEIDLFLGQVRRKFIGYAVPEEDRTTTAGLPGPILESISILQKHLYESLGELQIKREDDIARFPLTIGEFNPEAVDSFAETLYRTLLPNLPQYLISLLKLLLASVSSVKSKSDAAAAAAAASTAAAANVLSDVGLMTSVPLATGGQLSEQANSVLLSLKLKIDLNRHQEIIIKAISAVLLLLLKHYKISHIYQFEYISQQLMFANCIPLVIKFISQEMADFIIAKNSVPVLDFPACVIGDQPELTSDTIELLTETQPYCWRNMFSSINLLRILNKLTKWKNCRIMMLVLFKSAQPLKRSLRIRHAMFQVYALKLLKMQAKFLGRQWRKNNMKTMSAIYQKVRHRLNDDWAFANDVDSKQLYFQTEEFLLQANINRFHNRRYEKPFPNANINSVTAQAFQAGKGQGGEYGQMGRWPGAGVIRSDSTSGDGSYPTTPSTPITASMFFDGSRGQQAAAAAASHMAAGVSPTLAAMVEADLLTPVDNNLLSVLSREVELTKDFKRNYEVWLEREVFEYSINWDELLNGPTGEDDCGGSRIHHVTQQRQQQQPQPSSTTTSSTNNPSPSHSASSILSGTSTVIRGASMSSQLVNPSNSSITI